jgi:hypothetical protein
MVTRIYTLGTMVPLQLVVTRQPVNQWQLSDAKAKIIGNVPDIKALF